MRHEFGGVRTGYSLFVTIARPAARVDRAPVATGSVQWKTVHTRPRVTGIHAGISLKAVPSYTLQCVLGSESRAKRAVVN